MRRDQVTTALLWGVALLAVGGSAYRRAQGAAAQGIGYDLGRFFLPAAQAVQAGRSPYEIDGYVYSPLVAWVLAPMSGWSSIGLVWPILSLVAGVAAALIVALALAPRWRHDWRAPVIFGIGGFTAISNWLTTHEMMLGQIQLIIVLVFVLAWRERHRRPWLTGVLLGLAGAIKTWPALVVVWAFSDLRRRAMVLAGAAAVMVAVAVAAASTLGLASFREWMSSTGRYSQQPQPVFGVWGVWNHLFVAGSVVDPIVVSPALRLLCTGLGLCLLLGLSFSSLHRSRDDSLGFWHIVATCVLVLPVAHFGYLLVLLPLMWVRIGLSLCRSARWQDHVATGAMTLWWFLSVRHAWSTLDTGTYLVMLLSTFSALSISVWADWSRRSVVPQ